MNGWNVYKLKLREDECLQVSSCRDGIRIVDKLKVISWEADRIEVEQLKNW